MILVGMLVVAIPTIEILRVKIRGASVKAQLVALLKDEVSYVAALISVVLVAQGYYLADPLASMFVATVKERVSREAGCQHCVIHVDPANNSTKTKSKELDKNVRV